MSPEQRIRKGPDGPRVEPGRPTDGRTAPAAPSRDGRSVPELVRELAGEGADLVRQEVALAKAEMDHKLTVFQRNLASMAIGGAFLLAALLTGLWAVNRGLTALLSQFLSLDVAVWLSPLILTGVLAAVGWGMIKKGKNAIGDEGMMPRHTTDTLKEDKRWAQRKAREMKEEMSHG